MPKARFSQRLLTLKRNKNPDPQKQAQNPPFGRHEVAQTLRKVKNKKEKALARIKKPKTKNLKKSQKKALTRTERPKRFRFSYVRKDEGENQAMWNLPRLKKICWKLNTVTKGPRYLIVWTTW